jgi:hypothetical protein
MLPAAADAGTARGGEGVFELTARFSQAVRTVSVLMISFVITINNLVIFCFFEARKKRDYIIGQV